MANGIIAGSSEREAQLELWMRRNLEELDSFSGILLQLGALFHALKDEKARADHLAELGQYVADDWANTVDLWKEELQGELAKLADPLLAKAA